MDNGVIYFKFKGQRAAEEKVTFEGMTISAIELKNLIAEKKGLDTSKDTYQLLNPKDQQPFPDSHTYVRGMKVLVRRVPLQQPGPRKHVAAGTAAGEEEEAPNQALALAQALAALPANAAGGGAAGDPNDEQGQLEQRKARQAITDLEAQAVAEAQHAAWQAQTDQNIRQTRQREQQLAQQGRGRGYGRGFGGRGPGSVPPICRYCGAVNAHFPDECPQRHAPRTDLRQVRAPTGIPASYVREDESGGLLLNTGKTGAVRTNDAEANSFLAALPGAKRAALAAAKAAQVPALADRPHEASADEGLLQTLLLDIEPASQGQQQAQQQQQEQMQDHNQPQQQQLSSQQDQHQQQQPPDSIDAMAPDEEAAPGLQPSPAGGDVPAVAADGGLGLFDDEDLLPPAAAEGAGLNLGIGMELDQPAPAQQPQQQQQQQPQEQQQAEPASSPLMKQLALVPAKSPVVQAVQAAAPGIVLTDALAEGLAYSRDLLKAWSHWDLKDLIPGFFAAKPLTPDDFEAMLAKYRERRQAASKQQQQQQQQQPSQEQWANGDAHDRREQGWDDRRQRSRPAPSPTRSPHGAHGGGDLPDRTRSRRERVHEREARDSNRLLRKERERELRQYSTSRSRSRSRGRAQGPATRHRSRSPLHAAHSPGRKVTPSSAERGKAKSSKRGREDTTARTRSRSRGRSPSREGREPNGRAQQQQGVVPSRSREAAEDVERQQPKRQRSASPRAGRVVADADGHGGHARSPKALDLQDRGASADLRHLLVDGDEDSQDNKPTAAAAAAAGSAEPEAAAATQQPGSKPGTPRANGVTAAGAVASPTKAAADTAAAAAGAAGEPAKKSNVFSRLGCMAPRIPDTNGDKAEAVGDGPRGRGRSPDKVSRRKSSRSRSGDRGGGGREAQQQQQQEELQQQQQQQQQQRQQGSPVDEESEEVLDVGDDDDEDAGVNDGGGDGGEGEGGGGDGSGGEGRRDKKHKKHKKHKKKKRRRERHGDEEGDGSHRHRSRSRSRSRSRHHRSRSRERERERERERGSGHHSRGVSPERDADRPNKRVRSTHQDRDAAGGHHSQHPPAERHSGRSVHDRLGPSVPQQPAAAPSGAEGRVSRAAGARGVAGAAGAGRPRHRSLFGTELQKTLSTQGSSEQRHNKQRWDR